MLSARSIVPLGRGRPRARGAVVASPLAPPPHHPELPATTTTSPRPRQWRSTSSRRSCAIEPLGCCEATAWGRWRAQLPPFFYPASPLVIKATSDIATTHAARRQSRDAVIER